MFTILVDTATAGGFVVRQSCPWQDSTIEFDDCYAELSDALEGARVALTATLELGGECEGVALSATVERILEHSMERDCLLADAS